MDTCNELGGNSQLRCRGYFLHEIGMYNSIWSKFTVGGTFTTALFSIPLMASAFFVNLFYLLVLIGMNAQGCFHRDFGIAYITFVLISLVHDGMLGSVLVRVLPWLERPAIEAAVTSHKACKYYSFVSDFLAATRINLLLAHCLIHIFSLQFFTERRKISFGIVSLNALCVLLGAFLAISASTVHGVWVVGNRLICLPDPEWPQIFIIFYMIHKALFCDGLVQSLVILFACFHLHRIHAHLSVTVKCLLFTTNSKFLLFDSLKRLRERTLRTRECLRVVYVHALCVAATRIALSIITIVFANFLYGTQRLDIVEWNVLENLLFYFTLFDLTRLLEVISNILHAWVAFFWQSTLRNTFLNFLFKVFRPFRRLRAWLRILVYTDTVPAAQEVEKEKEKKSPSFDKNFLKYSRLLASRLTDENLKNALSWLLNAPNLPKEIEDFLMEWGVLPQK